MMTRLKAYFHELIIMMPWLGPHIAKRNGQGSKLQVLKYTMPTIIVKGRDSLSNMMNDRMKLFTSGETT